MTDKFDVDTEIGALEQLNEELDAHESAEPLLNESKGDAFKRIANARSKKAVKYIRLLKNLTGPNYEYTLDQANKLVDVLKNEVDNLEYALEERLRDDRNIEDLF